MDVTGKKSVTIEKSKYAFTTVEKKHDYGLGLSGYVVSKIIKITPDKWGTDALYNKTATLHNLGKQYNKNQVFI